MTLFEAQSGWVLAALAASWTAVALLALTVANLHARMRRLEQRGAQPAAGATPYARLVGRRVALPPGVAPAAIVWVRANCEACARVLHELSAGAPSAMVASVDREAPALPPGVAVLPSGPALAAELGIGVTPFAIALDPSGTIVKAGPIGSPRGLRDWVPRASEPALQVFEVNG